MNMSVVLVLMPGFGMIGSVTVGIGGCTDSNACNFNVSADFNDNSCTYTDASNCESCSNGYVVYSDDDNDGICTDIDTCVGIIDSCGVCGGDGSSCVAYGNVPILISSTEAVAGIQFNLTGGGTYTTPYASPINQPTDVLPRFIM